MSTLLDAIWVPLLDTICMPTGVILGVLLPFVLMGLVTFMFMYYLFDADKIFFPDKKRK